MVSSADMAGLKELKELTFGTIEDGYSCREEGFNGDGVARGI